jgi:MFS family permease
MSDNNSDSKINPSKELGMSDDQAIKRSLINEDGDDDATEEHAEGSSGGARSSSLRWILLMFGNFFLFGSYYCYDIPSAL